MEYLISGIAGGFIAVGMMVALAYIIGGDVETEQPRRLSIAQFPPRPPRQVRNRTPPPAPTGEALTLPDDLLDRKLIKYMQVGDHKYTLPWSVMTDPDHKVWINGDYPAEDHPGGTVQMEIARTEEGIAILRGMEPQQPSKVIPWVGSSRDDLLPVVRVP